MAIFENFDQLDWILFALLAVAAVAYYLWPQTTKAQAEVTLDEATRKTAKPLIALATDVADAQLFELSQTPLRVRVGPGLQSGKPLDAAQIREALWNQQRAMITRLESELDYAQQADVNDHFAIAAPANQPGALLAKTLGELQTLYGQMRKMLQLPEDHPFWHGRALICMMSTRKLFDHVAWLSGAGLANSAPGAYVTWEQEIVTISIYATRLGGFARPLTLQVCRGAVNCVGGENTPKWLEYGLAHWMTTQTLGKPEMRQDEKPPQWSDDGKVIFDAATWDRAQEDSTKLEQLVLWSMLFVQHAMQQSPGRLLADLKQIRTNSATVLPSMTQWALANLPPVSPA